MAGILGASLRASVDFPETGSLQISTSRVRGPATRSSVRSEVTEKGYGTLSRLPPNTGWVGHISAHRTWGAYCQASDPSFPECQKTRVGRSPTTFSASPAEYAQDPIPSLQI